MAEGSGSIFSHSRDVDVDARVGTQRNTIFFVIIRRRCPFLYSPYHETIRSDRDQFYTAYPISYIHYFFERIMDVDDTPSPPQPIAGPSASKKTPA